MFRHHGYVSWKGQADPKMGVCLQNASPVIGASVTRSNKYIDLPAPENLSTCSSVYSQLPGASKIERSVRAPRCARLARGLEDDYPVPASRCVRSLARRLQKDPTEASERLHKDPPPKAWSLGDDPKRHESHIGSNNTPRDAVTWEL